MACNNSRRAGCESNLRSEASEPRMMTDSIDAQIGIGASTESLFPLDVGGGLAKMKIDPDHVRPCI